MRVAIVLLAIIGWAGVGALTFLCYRLSRMLDIAADFVAHIAIKGVALTEENEMLTKKLEALEKGSS